MHFEERALHEPVRSHGTLRPFSRGRRALVGALAAGFVSLGPAHAGAPASAAEAAPQPAWHAGQTARATKTASAGVRNHGDETLRMLVWYPATPSVPETPVVLGSPESPIFMAGRVAIDAPWADAARHPLVMLSHGFGGTGLQMTWLGSALARHGFVAVAVDHPGTNGRDGVTPQGAFVPWERAPDISAALDLVLADPVIGSHVDPSRVGVAGFSLGGWTSALLAGARTDFARFDAFCASKERDSICDPQVEFPLDFTQRDKTLAQPAMRPLAAHETADFRDARIKAALLIAPALGEATAPASLARVAIPVVVVAGSADPVAIPATNAALFANGIPGARLVLLPRVRHYDFLSECGAAGLKVSPVYCTDGEGTRRADTHAATIRIALDFFDGVFGLRPSAVQAGR
jgi:predicted dienelactone hydrolase